MNNHESVGAKLTNSEDSGFFLSGNLAVTHPSIVSVCAVRMVVVLQRRVCLCMSVYTVRMVVML